MIKKSDFYLVPNILSISRIAAIPLVSVLAYFEIDRWAAVAFALAGISDYIDGYIARRYHSESKLGVLLDPLADKIIILCVMVLLLFLGRLHFEYPGYDLRWVGPLLVIVTVGREIAITGIRSIASTMGMMMPADKYGKLKTWIQFFAILFLLYNSPGVVAVGKVLLVFSVFTALWSGFRYTLRFFKKLPE